MILAALALLVSTAAHAQVGGRVIDPRDNESYPTIEIAGSTWMARNLVFNAPGSSCPEGHDCKSGRLYPWPVAMSACPAGWHLATEEEWQRLERHLGMEASDLAREKERGPGTGDSLKPGGSSRLDIPLAGWRRPDGSYRSGNGNDRAGAVWTAGKDGDAAAWHRDLSSARTGIWRSSVPIAYSLSVRCTKDAAQSAARPLWPGRSWPTATPESQGVDAAALRALDRDIRAGVHGNIDHLLVIRGGYAVFNERYARDYAAISRGKVSALGCGDGCVDPARMHQYNYFHPTFHPYYQGRPVHTLQSVTKSIAATVLGMALPTPQDVKRPFLEYFRDRGAPRDPRLRQATVEDVLTMRTGIEWHEQDRPLDETNTTLQLEHSSDWIAFTLSQPMDADPGTKWVYNSGGSQLMAGIVQSITKRTLDDYAREHLFAPIGITDFHWKKTPTGHPDTEGGLYLAAEDLARLGYLYLHDGVWNGRRILPERWVAEATKRHVTGVAPGWDYGYQWWITSRNDVDIWAGRGFGNQFLLVIPSRDIVAVINGWNVFGERVKPVLGPLLDVLAASRGGR